MYLHEHMIWIATWWFIEIAAIVIVFWLLAIEFRTTSEEHGAPEDILKRRLASGEIDAEEYEKRMSALSKTKRVA